MCIVSVHIKTLDIFYGFFLWNSYGKLDILIIKYIFLLFNEYFIMMKKALKHEHSYITKQPILMLI